MAASILPWLGTTFWVLVVYALLWLAPIGLLVAISIGVQHLRHRGRRRNGAPIDHGATYRMRQKMLRMARPTFLLVPTKAPGFSKLGGLPELPSGTPWPAVGGEAPTFVAQIDIAAFRAHGGFDWLPDKGQFYLFFDDSLNGAADCGKLTYGREPPGPEVVAPPGLPKNRRFAERRVGFMRFTSLPSWDWLDEDWPSSNVDWESFDFLKDCDFGDEIEHRIGGYPSEIQGGQMALECEYLHRGRTRDYGEPVPDDVRRASWQWRLLLQIDSDPDLSMNWWDAGRLYVFIRARDAKRGDFSKTVTITQTH